MSLHEYKAAINSAAVDCQDEFAMSGKRDADAKFKYHAERLAKRFGSPVNCIEADLENWIVCGEIL